MTALLLSGPRVNFIKDRPRILRILRRHDIALFVTQVPAGQRVELVRSFYSPTHFDKLFKEKGLYPVYDMGMVRFAGQVGQLSLIDHLAELLKEGRVSIKEA